MRTPTRGRWLTGMLAAPVVFGVFAVASLIAGEVPAAIVGAGAAVVGVLDVRVKIWSWRSGYFAGRGSAFAEVARHDRGLPVSPPTVDDVNPWDPFPSWPDDE